MLGHLNKPIAACIVLITVGILAALGICVAGAAGPPPGSGQAEDLKTKIDTFKNRAEHLTREIEKSRQEVKNFTRREADILRQLNQVELSLDKSRRRAGALKTEIKQLERNIAAAEKDAQNLNEKIRANEKYVARRLVALYKMNWLGKFHLLASAESLHEFMQRRAALERILAHDGKIRQQLMENQQKLDRVLQKLENQKSAKRTRMDEYKRQMQAMARKKAIRTRLLADIRSQKSLELAAIEALTRNARQLDRKIKSLGDRLTAVRRDNNSGQRRFFAHKGLLIMPVKGKIVSLFGPYKNRKYNITNFRSGIEIQADTGTPVRCVFNGRVLYASWFKGYGNMIIIDHGDNFYTVYAHLKELFASKDDTVKTGDVIATVGDTGSMTGTRLYFEIRHHGKPENPLQWIKTG
jgi:septal ring factor EnvC (AmiA/AmiB activator)